jgi:hypothetical protein
MTSSVPQLTLSFSDDSQREAGSLVTQSSVTIGPGELSEEDYSHQPVSQSSSVQSRKSPELRECAKCGRRVNRVDREYEQCERCNGDELREVTRRTLVEQLPPSQAWAYATELERYELAALMDPDDPCLRAWTLR